MSFCEKTESLKKLDYLFWSNLTQLYATTKDKLREIHFSHVFVAPKSAYCSTYFQNRNFLPKSLEGNFFKQGLKMILKLFIFYYKLLI